MSRTNDSDIPETKRPADPEYGTGRGREAHSPRTIPPSGWRDIPLRTWRALGEDNVSLLAAGVAFYGLLALFPGIAVLVSVFGLVTDKQLVEAQFAQASEIFPQEAWTLVNEQLVAVASQPDSGLTLAAIIGLALSLFSARLAAAAMIGALNVIYNESESRHWIHTNLLAIGFTIGSIILMLVALTAIIIIPLILQFVGLDSYTHMLVSALRWPLLALIIFIGLAVLYRYGPDRRRAKWRWISWGSGVAVALWLAGSIAFSAYVEAFGSFNESYGSLGAVVILLLWMWLSAYVILLGAELDMQMEHQTKLWSG
jgi:membrane protein